MQEMLASLRSEERPDTGLRLPPMALIALIALALAATSLALHLTRTGAGASGDSAHYIMGARNLAEGRGYTRLSGNGELRPITGFPPGFSIVLAGFGLLGVDAFDAARGLNALLFGVNVVLAALLIHRICGSSIAAILGAALFLAQATLIELHSWIMSEPLYITLFLAGAWTLGWGLVRENRWLYLISGLIAGAALLTRYVGLSALLAGASTILLLGDRKVGWRVGSAALFGSPAIILLVAWFVRNSTANASLVNREILFHPLDATLIAAYQAELIAWLFARQLPIPWRPRALLAVATAGIGPAYYLATWLRRDGLRRQRGNQFEASMPWFLTLYLVFYLGVLTANSLFLDAATTLSAPDRYLAPAYLATVILAASTVTLLVRNLQARTQLPRVIAIALGALLIILHVSQSVRSISGSGFELGYVGIRQQWPEMVAQLAELQSKRPLISNNPELVYILIGQPAHVLPASYDPYSDRPREDYLEQVALSRELLSSGGVLAMFGRPDELAVQAMEDIGVEPFAWFDAAIFYRAPSGGGG